MNSDPRQDLVRAQQALQRGNLQEAGRAFERAAHGFAGPAELLGAGHGMRGLAHVALQIGSYDRSRALLEQAEALYHAGTLMVHGLEEDAWKALRLDLVEALATTYVLDADALLRRGRLAEARTRLQKAEPLYRELVERPSLSDLYTVQARLADRAGDWATSRDAWERVLGSRFDHHDEPGVCDARIRLAEAMVADGEVDEAHEVLDQAMWLARELDDPTLQGRVSAARARALEVEQDWPGAWEKWQDALMELEGADPVARGLAQVRMTRTAARLRPSESWGLLENGLHDLLEGEYPDAVQLVLHQLAVVALSLGRRRTGALAAVGADRAPGGSDPALRGLLFRALLGIGARDAAFLYAQRENLKRPGALPAEVTQTKAPFGLDLTDAVAVDTRFRRVVEDALHGDLLQNGLTADELGSRRMVFRLAGGVTEQVTPALDGDPLELIWSLREGEDLRHPLAGVSLVGRGRANAIRMSWDGLASRTHCVIEERDGGVFVRDLDSHHGTFVDDARVEAEEQLQAGQTLRVGETEFAVGIREPVKAAVARVAIPIG